MVSRLGEVKMTKPISAIEFTATGGAPVGFLCDGKGGYNEGADITGQVVGVLGTATDGDGVQGFGAENSNGVSGFGAANGSGVFGEGGTNGGAGVRGYGGGITTQKIFPTDASGVFGEGGPVGSGVQGVAGETVSGVGASGVVALANPNGGSNGFFGSAQGNATNSAGRFRGMVEFNSQLGVTVVLPPGPAHIRMIPVDLTADPNTAQIPGQAGDLLAVSNSGPFPGIGLWFHTTDTWKQIA
jgi:hypothetical protein